MRLLRAWGKRVKIGEDVSEVLEKVPVEHKVIRYVRPKYACQDLR